MSDVGTLNIHPTHYLYPVPVYMLKPLYVGIPGCLYINSLMFRYKSFPFNSFSSKNRVSLSYESAKIKKYSNFAFEKKSKTKAYYGKEEY